MAARSGPSRWTTLAYDGDHYFSSLPRIVDSATGIQHLTIAMNFADFSPTASPLPNPTKLRTLHLRSFYVPWTGLDSLRLESLWLECLSNSPTDDQIFGVLRSSPRLRRLVLREFHTPDGTFLMSPLPEPMESGPVNLFYLETLVVEWVLPSLSHSLLWRLHVPSCKILHLSDCHSIHFGAASSSELPKTIRPLLRTAKEIRLKYEARSNDGSGPLHIRTLDPTYIPSRLPFLVDSSGLCISVVLRGVGAWNDLADAVGLKSFAGTTILSLGTIRFFNTESRADSTAIAFIQRVAEDMRQTVDAFEFSTKPLPILQHLSIPQPVTGAGSLKYWPCPKLRHISIKTVARWLEADRDEILQQCIAVLRRSSARVDELVPPRQLEEFSLSPSLGLGETLDSMDEFQSVRFSGI